MGPFLGCRASASILLLHKEREVEREIDRSIDPTSTCPKVLLDKGRGSGYKVEPLSIIAGAGGGYSAKRLREFNGSQIPTPLSQ